MPHRKDALWSDRKRNFLGLPWTFTQYTLVPDRLLIDRGFFNSREDEVRLYRITDLTLTRNLGQKIIGTGTIHVDSADPTLKNFDIINIKGSYDVKEQLSQIVEKSRREAHVYMRENMQQAPNEKLEDDRDMGHDGIPDEPEDRCH